MLRSVTLREKGPSAAIQVVRAFIVIGLLQGSHEVRFRSGLDLFRN